MKILDAERCTGCSGCRDACPTGAIAMRLDAEGFYRPEVDDAVCMGCQACRKHCPVLIAEHADPKRHAIQTPQVFAAWSKNEALRLSSSSGGVFSELAVPVIAAGGWVAGCVWGKEWVPEHVLTDCVADLQRMRGSKYAPSRTEGIYLQVLNRLQSSSGPVLFSGTPCQVAAMAGHLPEALRERVLLVDLICHGVPSLRVFQKYQSELFAGEAINFYDFRDKERGWATIRAKSASGKTYVRPAGQDAFFAGFASHHLYMQNICHECCFAAVPRQGDISLGDFWGCPEEWDDPRGVSLVLANTPRGSTTLKEVEAEGRLVLKRTELSVATRTSRCAVFGGQHTRHQKREIFLAQLAAGEPFAALVARHFPSPARMLWLRFRRSDSKLGFLGNLILSLSRRVLSGLRLRTESRKRPPTGRF